MNGKKINEFPSGSGTLSDDDIFLMMDNPLESGAITKSLSLGVLRTNINELVLSDLTTVSGIVDGVSGVLRADLTTVSGIVDGIIVTNSGDNRILTSDGTNRGINAESLITATGSRFQIGASGLTTQIDQPPPSIILYSTIDDTAYISFKNSAGTDKFNIIRDDEDDENKIVSFFSPLKIDATNQPIIIVSNGLLYNGTQVSVSGHSHTASNITDFNSSVSGLLPTIANSGDNRILTSTGSTRGINAESNLTFNGTTLGVSGALQVDKINIDDYAIKPTLPSQPGGRYVLAVSTDFLDVDTTQYSSVRGSGGFSVFGAKNPTIFIHNEEPLNYSPELKLYQGSIFSGSSTLTIGSYNQNNENAISNNRNINAIVSNGNYDLQLATTSGNIILEPGAAVKIYGITKMGDSDPFYQLDIGFDMLGGDLGITHNNNSYIAVKIPGDESYRYGGNGDNPAIVINSGLSVGIKKDNPSYTLDVNGSGNFSSGLFVSGIPVSVSGHTHAHNQIFVSGVSGVAPIGNNASNFLYEVDNESSLLTINGQVITTQSNKSLRTIQGGYGLEKAIDLLGGINTSNINNFNSTVSGIVINILQQLNIIGY